MSVLDKFSLFMFGISMIALAIGSKWLFGNLIWNGITFILFVVGIIAIIFTFKG